MKTNFTKALVVFILLALASPAMAFTDATVPETTETRAVELQNRLEEIKSMDKRTLSHAEKKILRKEVRVIKKELAASGGVYLSIGAILLIALLLILLL